MKPNELTRLTIGAAIEVHREMGPGKPEAAYELALAHELGLRGIPYRAQKPVPVVYKGVKLECGYRLDVLVDNTLVVEAKSVELMNPIHRAQTLTYLRLGGWKLALLLNFNVAVLKDGIERLVLRFSDDTTEVQASEVACRQADPGHNGAFIRGRDSGDSESEGLAREIIAAALEVHSHLGPGLLPSTYEICLCHEMHLRGLPFERQRPLPLIYKGTLLSQTDEIRLLVGGRVVVSPRAVPGILPVHQAELLSQLRLGGWGLGLLINFNSTSLRGEIRRVVLTRRRV